LPLKFPLWRNIKPIFAGLIKKWNTATQQMTIASNQPTITRAAS
jgi:hypothetical protein